eukprot:jgi/Bigna1/76272/fgenesh1_pg.40_\
MWRSMLCYCAITLLLQPLCAERPPVASPFRVGMRRTFSTPHGNLHHNTVLKRLRLLSSAARSPPLAGSASSSSSSPPPSPSDFPTLDPSVTVELKDPYKLYKQLAFCDDATIAGAISRSLDIMLQAFRLYGPEGVIVSFNGGKPHCDHIKDAVVVMHLARAALAKYKRDRAKEEKGAEKEEEEEEEDERLRVIYFLSEKNEFPEVRNFVQEQVDRYSLNIQTHCTDFVSGLTSCIDEEQKKIDASASSPSANKKTVHLGFVLGTRKGDPNCGDQRYFEPSSTWLPPFMRINPILDWDYGQIWRFLLWPGIEYPSLYDNWRNARLLEESPPQKARRLLFSSAHALRLGRSKRQRSSVDCELEAGADDQRLGSEIKTAGLSL